MAQESSLDEVTQGPSVATRRAVLVGAGAAAVVVLAGCATYDQNAPAAPVTPAVTQTGPRHRRPGRGPTTRARG